VTPSSIFIELNKTIHDRKAFDCGVERLNAFFSEFAARHREAGISLTMVLPAQENLAHICAYYTLSHTEIERRTLPQSALRKLPHHPVPVLLLARLAVHKGVHGQGLGKTTLIGALRRCLEINAHLPSYAVVVDALEDGVTGFYARYGFQPLGQDNGRPRLFLPMKTIRQLFSAN
jgi:predicted N-acetyltransferase YhbS